MKIKRMIYTTPFKPNSSNFYIVDCINDMALMLHYFSTRRRESLIPSISKE